MLPVVMCAGVLLADLARPVRPEEYRRVIGQQVLLHEPMPSEVRAYYLAKGRVLAGFLRVGMTDGEVREDLGVRPSGWVQEEDQEGERWTHHYALLGLMVCYHVASTPLTTSTVRRSPATAAT